VGVNRVSISGKVVSIAFFVEAEQQFARIQMSFPQRNLEDGTIVVESERPQVLHFAKHAYAGFTCECAGELKFIDGVLHLHAYDARGVRPATMTAGGNNVQKCDAVGK
jgi:hypothetical protein